ncbi:MAG TPA: hypothetical protein VH559_08915 [Gemmatimonadaceae bacterium]|jgi:hypothetical protein
MRAFFYRIRGVLGTAVVWGIVWATVAFPTFALLLRHFPIRWAGLALLARAWGLAGAGTGATFALLVVAFERRRTFAKFSPRRAATWGMLAGAGYASLTIARFLAQIERPGTQIAASIVMGGFLGGASAALTMVLARRSKAVAEQDTRDEIAAPVT